MKKSDAKDYTVYWWMGWITLTILSFFVSYAFWTDWIAKNVGTMDRPGVPVLWVALVFGSWMVLLVPLIVIMYNKVDKSYEDARLARESRQEAETFKELGVRAVALAPKDRLLSETVIARLKKIPNAIPRGHVGAIRLKDGREFQYAFIQDKKELMGVYDQSSIDFKGSDIEVFVPADLDRLPVFESSRWLRLDGVGGAV